MIGLRLYDGLFKVIPLELDSNKELKAFNIRSGSYIALHMYLKSVKYDSPGECSPEKDCLCLMALTDVSTT